MKLMFSIYVVLAILMSAPSYSNERRSEIDAVYAKLMSVLPDGELIHVPYASNLNSYGKGQKFNRIENGDVTGGEIFQVNVTKRHKKPWDAGVVAPIAGSFKEGDVLYMIFWARAKALPKGKDFALLKNAGIQQAAKPYQGILSKDIKLTEKWQSLALATKANASYENGQAQVNFQIGTGKQILEFGPVFVFNLGAGVDTATLPFLAP